MWVSAVWGLGLGRAECLGFWWLPNAVGSPGPRAAWDRCHPWRPSSRGSGRSGRRPPGGSGPRRRPGLALLRAGVSAEGARRRGRGRGRGGLFLPPSWRPGRQEVSARPARCGSRAAGSSHSWTGGRRWAGGGGGRAGRTPGLGSPLCSLPPRPPLPGPPTPHLRPSSRRPRGPPAVPQSPGCSRALRSRAGSRTLPLALGHPWVLAG